jgi:hypothetical protein
MDRYNELTNSILTELVKPPSQPPALVSPTAGTANITAPIAVKPSTLPTTATSTGLPANPLLRPQVRTPIRGGGGALAAALTLAAVGWDVYKAIRAKYQERNQPIPMTMPPGYKEGDVILPPVKPGGQGFAVPQPIKPAILPDTAPEQQPEQTPQKPITLPNVVPGKPDYEVPGKPSPEPRPMPQPRPVIPPKPRPSEEPLPQPAPQPVPQPTPVPPSKTSTGFKVDTARASENDPQSKNKRFGGFDTNTGKGTDGEAPFVPPAGKIIPPVPLPVTPSATSPDEVKSQKADQFDFKSYPQGYNPDEPYGRWGPTSARRDNTKASPEYIIQQPFNSDEEPPIVSATPETETGPWAKRYKRYKDWYNANPEAGQPTSFGNILKKSK